MLFFELFLPKKLAESKIIRTFAAVIEKRFITNIGLAHSSIG